ncbi:MAG: cation transporter [Lachnospiraceae bacterium]|nr:cation transporter [Lachnospiraceae bacterium]
MEKKKARGRERIRKSENRIMVAFLLNMMFTLVEIWGSVVTGSVTILSDAMHDFGDCIALGMAWRMEKISKKPSNERYHFGYRRFSVVAGLINNLILLMGGVVLIVTSVQRFFYPRSIDGRGMILFAVFGILINGAAMLLTAKGKNINEKTISTHMLEDVLTWMTVFVVGVVMCFYDLPVLDSFLSIGMTFVVFAGAVRNLNHIFSVLTVRSPLEKREYFELRERLTELNAFGNLEALRVFSMNGEDRNAEAELVLYEEISPEDMMLLYEQVKDCCKEYGIGQTVLQIRYEVSGMGEES